MGKLSDEAAAQYQEQGYYAPIRALSTAEAGAARARMEAHEAAHGKLKGDQRHKPHLLFTWLDRLVRHPGILDAVEGAIGPNILAWGSSFFVKEAHDPSFVSWHQDSTYWGLDPADIVTAWVALSDSNRGNGAMRVIPGSHKLDQVPHRDTFAPTNLLSRGQEIMVEVDPSKAVMLELEPGEISLHHVRLIHGSDPNPSGERRIGFAIRYLPTHVRQTVATRDSAMLVRGVDDFHNFEPEQPPESDLAPAAIAQHATVIAAMNAGYLLRDTPKAKAG